MRIEGNPRLTHLRIGKGVYQVLSGRGRLLGSHTTRKDAVEQIRRRQSAFHGQGLSKFSFRDLGIREC